jgi:hypothetical protein
MMLTKHLVSEVGMARWTVLHGDQVMVIEATGEGLVSVDIPSRTPFVTDPEGIRDMRSKLGLAIGEAQADSGEPR